MRVAPPAAILVPTSNMNPRSVDRILMPGILGIIDVATAPVPRELLAAMARASPWRGPSHTSHFESSLAVATQDTADNPDTTHGRASLEQDAESDIVVVIDGRLDNRSELTERLPPAGPSRLSDAGLLRRAYQRWGVSCTDHLQGEFAFTVWDGRTRTVICARDVFGVRPLYYARQGTRFYFASDMAPLMQVTGVAGEPDELGIADQLINSVVEPGRTVIGGVKRLPNGSSLAVSPDGEKVRRYWQPENLSDLRYRRDEDYTQHFDSLFRDAVEHRLGEGRLPAGLLLSGGLDSSSIAAMSTRLQSARDEGVVAVSAVFPDFPACDESSYLGDLYRKLGLRLETIDVGALPLLSDPAHDPCPLELPFRFGHRLARTLFEAARAAGTRIVLTGTGGDTLMAGSRMVYLDQLLAGNVGALTGVRRVAAARGIPTHSLYSQWLLKPLMPAPLLSLGRRLRRGHNPHIPAWISSDFRRRCALDERLYAEPTLGAATSRARRAILLALVEPRMERALRTMDYCGAMAGVQVSHPYLDRRIAEFVAAIPPEKLQSRGMNKLLLRRAMKRDLPPSVLQRTDKTTLTPFIQHQLRTVLVQTVHRLLDRSLLQQLGLVDAGRARTAYDAFVDRGEFLDLTRFWAMLDLETWLDARNQNRGQGPEPLATPAGEQHFGYTQHQRRLFHDKEPRQQAPAGA